MKNKKFPGWVVLTVICCVAGVLIAAVNLITKDKIVEQQLLQINQSCQRLLPEASDFPKTEAEGFTYYEGVDAAGNKVGYVAVTTASGFGGEIEIMSGVDLNGVLTGIQVGGSNFAETAGLGAKAKEPEFQDQFAGKTYPLDLTKNGGEIDAITSATITSRAVVGGVNDAFEKLAGTGCIMLENAEAAETETAAEEPNKETTEAEAATEEPDEETTEAETAAEEPDGETTEAEAAAEEPDEETTEAEAAAEEPDGETTEAEAAAEEPDEETTEAEAAAEEPNEETTETEAAAEEPEPETAAAEGSDTEAVKTEGAEAEAPASEASGN